MCRKRYKKGHCQSHFPFSEEEEEEVEEEGHFQIEDPVYLIDSDEEDEAHFYQAMFLMSKKHKNDVVTPSMVVLGAGSSASAFYNQDLLKRIVETPKTLRLVTNGGETRAKKMGMRHELRAWFNPESIANILSFSEVAKNHRVRMDAAKDEDIW